MKKIISLACAFVMLTLTNCSKDATLVTEQSTQDIKTAIVGSWEFIGKGTEVAMHEGHICSDPENMAADKITYIINWEYTTGDEKQDFKQNGDYHRYRKSAIACQGSYKISEIGILELNTNCQNQSAKIEEVTPIFLTIKEGGSYFKYRKL